MQKKLSLNYIPFGSQYYRAPSPHNDDWEHDLANMARNGFNMVKFWVQWRWNNPAENKYYFDDIDKLMELAKKHNLKVMLNTIFDVAPAWIYKKYPDASMVTLNGRKIAPQTQPHRQIGGLGYCFNHDGVMKYFFDFLSETVNRYKEHPALEIWNVASEPELTSSMAEMRLYADDADKIGDMLCYCDNCREKFKVWLNNKYSDIGRLNISWNRNYSSFDEIELPLTRNTFNDIIDWRMFFVNTIGENVKKRFETAQGIDQGKHPLMCHHVFIQGFPVTSTASDPWNVGKYGDLHGFTQMDDAMMIDVLRSCAKDKPVISAEMLMLMGYTLDMPLFQDENDVKRLIFRGVAGNLKGFIFWQFRPEILGREAPAWGLTNLDGTETPWLKAFSKVGKMINKNSNFLINAKPPKAEIAILYNPENQIFTWASTGNEKNATNSLLGVHKALYESNYNVDFIHPMEIETGILTNYKVVYIPFPYFLNEKICGALEQWVGNGGVLIGECYFAGWNVENGHHEKIIPGYGMHRVFKSRQAIVEPAQRTKIKLDLIKDLLYSRKENKIISNIEKKSVLMKQGSNTNSDSIVEIVLKQNIPGLSADSIISGTMIKETLISEGSDVIAEFDTGEPAITISNYGKGKAVLIGTYLGLANNYRENENNAKMISGIVEFAGGIKKCNIIGKGARTDVLRDNNKIMVIVQNLTQFTNEISIFLPTEKADSLVEQFTNERISPINDLINKQILLNLKLEPKEVKVFISENAK